MIETAMFFLLGMIIGAAFICIGYFVGEWLDD